MISDTVITDSRSLPEISQLGLVEQNILQINCQRAIGNNYFTQGTQDFMFSVAGNQKWSPSRSYFRARATLQVTDDNTANPVVWRNPVESDGIAFAEGFMNNVYSNAYCFASSVDISSLTQFCGQASMLKHRLTKSKPWLDSIGKTHFLNADFSDRVALTASDGTSGLVNISETKTWEQLGLQDTDTITCAVNQLTVETATAVDFKVGDVIETYGHRLTIEVVSKTAQGYDLTVTPKAPIAGVEVAKANGFTRIRYIKHSEHGFNSVETIFQPPIGIFSTDSAMPSGSYRISLVPKSDLLSAVETKAPLPAKKEFKVSIDSLYFFMSVFRSETSFDNGTYYLSLDEMNISTKTLNQGMGQNSLNFTIPSSTIGIGAFVQDVGAGTNSVVPPSKFKSSDSSSDAIKTIQITYSNVSKPVQNFDSDLSVSVNPANASKQYLTQRYIDSAINSELYHVSCETFDDYLTRGPIYYYSWIRSADDRSTEAQLQCTFNNLQGTNNIFLTAIYRNLIKISVENGLITSVAKLMM